MDLGTGCQSAIVSDLCSRVQCGFPEGHPPPSTGRDENRSAALYRIFRSRDLDRCASNHPMKAKIPLLALRNASEDRITALSPLQRHRGLSRKSHANEISRDRGGFVSSICHSPVPTLSVGGSPIREPPSIIPGFSARSAPSGSMRQNLQSFSIGPGNGGPIRAIRPPVRPSRVFPRGRPDAGKRDAWEIRVAAIVARGSASFDGRLVASRILIRPQPRAVARFLKEMMIVLGAVGDVCSPGQQDVRRLRSRRQPSPPSLDRSTGFDLLAPPPGLENPHRAITNSARS
jgi:hypothetical protein